MSLLGPPRTVRAFQTIIRIECDFVLTHVLDRSKLRSSTKAREKEPLPAKPETFTINDEKEGDPSPYQAPQVSKRSRALSIEEDSTPS